MASTKYAYTISTDCKNGAVDTTKFKAEIEASSITTVLERIDTLANVCDVWFAAALTAGEKTTLDGDASPPAAGSLVWEHDGDPAKVEIERLHLTLPEEVVGVGASKAVVNDRPAITLQAGQDAHGVVAVIWPRDLDVRAELRVCMQVIIDAAGTGGDVVLEGKVKRESPGDDSSAAFSIVATDVVPVNFTNPGDVFRGDVVLSAASFAKGDAVALQVGRKGTDAADDVDVAIHLLAVEGEVHA